MKHIRGVLTSFRKSEEQWICPACQQSQQRRRRNLHSRAGAFQDVHAQSAESAREPLNDSKRLKNEASKTPYDGPSDSSSPRHLHGEDFVHPRSQDASPKPRPRRSPDLPPSIDALLWSQWRRPKPETAPSYDDKYGIFHSLSHGNPDMVVQALANAREDHDYLHSLPPALWSSILKSVDPAEWDIPMHRVHRAMSSAAMKRLIKSRYDFVRLFSNIVAIRRDAGLQLELPDYRLLLSYSARIGHRRMARALWSDMRKDNVKPDLHCFRSLLDATMFDEEMRLQQGKGAYYNIPRHDEVPSPTPIRKFLHAHSEEMIEIFRTLTERENFTPNADVLCSLMTSLAHDGHIDAASRLLHQYWDIDVTAIMDGKESRVRELQQSHPLYPRTKLLITIADAYGLHNRLPLAYALVDLISKSYNISITHNTWFALLEWTFLHSAHEAREEHRQTLAVPPQLSRLPKILETMMTAEDRRSPKSERQPTIDMLHLYFKNLFPQRVKFKPEFREPLYAGRALTLRRVQEARQLKHSIHEARSFYPGRVDPTTSLTSLSRLQHKRDKVEAEKRRHLGLMMRWVKNVLSSGLPDRTPLAPERVAQLNDWYLRGLPNFMLEWIGLLPMSFRYQLRSVAIHIFVRTTEENARISTVMDEQASKRKSVTWLDLSKVEKPWIQQKSPSIGTRKKLQDRGQESVQYSKDGLDSGWREGKRMSAEDDRNPLKLTNPKSGELRKGAFEVMKTPRHEWVEDELDKQAVEDKGEEEPSFEDPSVQEDADVVGFRYD